MADKIVYVNPEDAYYEIVRAISRGELQGVPCNAECPPDKVIHRVDHPWDDKCACFLVPRVESLNDHKRH